MKNLEKAFKLFDEYNQQDPVQLIIDGKSYPSEYFYAQQVYKWINRLEPEPDEALLLASRCQHIGRWEISRLQYPAGKAGYLKWRKELAQYHAEKAAELLAKAGYDSETINKVQQIVLKRDLKTNHNSQVMENALCLVFLEFQYDDFLKKYDDVKLIGILKKTWAKMSEPGRTAALTLPFSGRGKELIEKALGQ